MIGSIVSQLTDNISEEEIKKAGLGAYYVDIIDIIRLN